MAVFLEKKFGQFTSNVMNLKIYSRQFSHSTIQIQDRGILRIFMLVEYGTRRFPNLIKNHTGRRIHMKGCVPT